MNNTFDRTLHKTLGRISVYLYIPGFLKTRLAKKSALLFTAIKHNKSFWNESIRSVDASDSNRRIF